MLYRGYTGYYREPQNSPRAIRLVQQRLDLLVPICLWSPWLRVYGFGVMGFRGLGFWVLGLGFRG